MLAKAGLPAFQASDFLFHNVARTARNIYLNSCLSRLLPCTVPNDSIIPALRACLQGNLNQQLRLMQGLQGAWQMVEAVTHRVILQAGDDPATAVAGRVVREVLQRVEQLGPARQRKQQRSPRFWEQQVEQELLPALDALASAAAAKGPPFDAQLRELLVLRAMATRVCTNPGCCQIRGCSEGRARSRRCSGCGVARYCCHACQLADFWAHRKVCPLLAAEGRLESFV